MKPALDTISEKTIDDVGILAKLELTGEEKIQAQRDMNEMLIDITKLNELDTSGVEPMTHVFPIHNVFREDVVMENDGRADALLNAPEKTAEGFKVPNTMG